MFLPSPGGQSEAVSLDPVEKAFESGRSGMLVLPGQLSQVFEAVGDGELASYCQLTKLNHTKQVFEAVGDGELVLPGVMPWSAHAFAAFERAESFRFVCVCVCVCVCVSTKYLSVKIVTYIQRNS